MTNQLLQADPRRHDLDALRAFAMLLGIVLHGAISFIPGGGVLWGVQDSQASPLYGLLLASIHGWRMPLFFLISGYFTAMLWKKRGLRALLTHRFKRIFLPLLFSMITVVPVMMVVAIYIRSQPSTNTTVDANAEATAQDSSGDSAAASDVDVFAAVVTGDQAALKTYLDAGGDVLAKDPYGSTPLHVACLFGRADAAKLLLEAKASLDVTNNDGQRPEDLLQLDWSTTSFIAQMVQVPVEQEPLLSGRDEIARAISETSGRSVTAKTVAGDNAMSVSGMLTMLFYVPVFHHLWFLWFLCWFVCAFAIVVKAVRLLRFPAISKHWLTSAWRYAWLIPLTAVPQYFMAGERFAYGPDTSVGPLPLPAVFAYYTVFFGYGVMYFHAEDSDVVIGRAFGWKLAAALLILLPVGLSLQGPESMGGRVLFSVMQVSYAWAMSFGMIGLFHRFCRSQRFWVRYLSDSSYWLYLVHIPLLMLLQFLVRDWALPSLVKFSLVCGVTTAVLLVSYQLLVRNTWIGALLNGRRYPDIRQALPHSSADALTEQPRQEAV